MKDARVLVLIAGLAPVLTAPATAWAQPGDDWVLVWSEEFDGNALDPERWNQEVNCWGGGNAERQCYTDRPENSHVGDGLLTLVARHETATGPAFPLEWNLPAQEADQMATRPFTSARLTTRGHAQWRYGRIEVRASLPGGQGVWPAIWMMPADNAYGGWAASGEIDIMEAVNLGEPCDDCRHGREDQVLGTLHYGGRAPDNVYSGNATHLPPPIDGFHTYAIEWSEGAITWFVDGEAYATQTSADWYSTADSAAGRDHAPFDRDFFLILNLAIGGNWPESSHAGGVSTDGFPKSMQVDWVRVYTCAQDPETGTVCRESRLRDSGPDRSAGH